MEWKKEDSGTKTQRNTQQHYAMSPSASEDVNTELNNADFLDIVEATRVHRLSSAQ